MSIPFAQIGFHADVILQSQEKVKTPNEKTGVPCLSCAQRGSGLTNEDALALWIRKAQTGLKIANLSRARGPSHPGYPISHHPLRRYGHSVSAPHRLGAPFLRSYAIEGRCDISASLASKRQEVPCLWRKRSGSLSLGSSGRKALKSFHDPYLFERIAGKFVSERDWILGLSSLYHENEGSW